jgi:hypothetical protein
MERHSASLPDLVGLRPTYPPPIRLVRTFRSDFRPIPPFLQDLLAEAPCSSCSDNQGRIIDLIKHIQTAQEIDEGCQGKLWFEIRRILKQDVLSNHHIFTDGRALRNHLLKFVNTGEDRMPLSPINLRISNLRVRVQKFEPIRSPIAQPSLPLQRQTSE